MPTNWKRRASRGKQLTKPGADSACAPRRFGLGECYLDNQQFDEAKMIFMGLQRNNRGTLESFVASYTVCQLVEAIREPPSKALEIRETAKESLRMVLEDLKKISPDNDMFRLPGLRPYDWWNQWAQDRLRILSAPPAKGSGDKVFR